MGPPQALRASYATSVVEAHEPGAVLAGAQAPRGSEVKSGCVPVQCVGDTRAVFHGHIGQTEQMPDRAFEYTRVESVNLFYVVEPSKTALKATLERVGG